MLPQFNKAKGMTDIIASKMKNLGEVNKMAAGGEVEDKKYNELEMIFAELLHAVNDRDVKLGAQALKDFFVCADSEPEEDKGPGALLINGEI